MTRYAAENFSLREENNQLRSLESVVNAQEAVAQISAELDEAFQSAMETENLTESKINSIMIRKGLANKRSHTIYIQYMWIISYCSTASAAPVSADTIALEKLKAQLLQKQSDFTVALQAFEEYQEVTK